MTTLYEEEDFWKGCGATKMKKTSYDKGNSENAPQKGADRVSHPSHYTQGGVECIEGIKAALGDEFPAYCQGNVLKYVWRWRHKAGVEDLRKAQVYLGWMIEAAEGKAE